MILGLHIGDWMWILVLSSIALFEIWATMTGQQTMTSSVKHLIVHVPWFRWVVIAALAIFTYHLTAWTFRSRTESLSAPCVDDCGDIPSADDVQTGVV